MGAMGYQKSVQTPACSRTEAHPQRPPSLGRGTCVPHVGAQDEGDSETARRPTAADGRTDVCAESARRHPTSSSPDRREREATSSDAPLPLSFLPLSRPICCVLWSSTVEFGPPREGRNEFVTRGLARFPAAASSPLQAGRARGGSSRERARDDHFYSLLPFRQRTSLSLPPILSRHDLVQPLLLLSVLLLLSLLSSPPSGSSAVWTMVCVIHGDAGRSPKNETSTLPSPPTQRAHTTEEERERERRERGRREGEKRAATLRRKKRRGERNGEM